MISFPSIMITLFDANSYGKTENFQIFTFHQCSLKSENLVLIFFLKMFENLVKWLWGQFVNVDVPKVIFTFSNKNVFLMWQKSVFDTWNIEHLQTMLSNTKTIFDVELFCYCICRINQLDKNGAFELLMKFLYAVYFAKFYCFICIQAFFIWFNRAFLQYSIYV